MRQFRLLLAVLFLAIPAWSQSSGEATVARTGAIFTGSVENHGANLSWGASTSAAACTGTCSNPCYQVYEGATSGGESATPLNSTCLTVLNYTDDGATLNSYLGTTRYYKIGYQQTVSGVTTVAMSAEVYATWGQAGSPPGTVVVITH